MKTIRVILSVLLGMLIYIPATYIFIVVLTSKTNDNIFITTICFTMLFFFSYLIYDNQNKKFKLWFNSKLKENENNYWNPESICFLPLAVIVLPADEGQALPVYFASVAVCRDRSNSYLFEQRKQYYEHMRTVHSIRLPGNHTQAGSSYVRHCMVEL